MCRRYCLQRWSCCRWLRAAEAAEGRAGDTQIQIQAAQVLWLLRRSRRALFRAGRLAAAGGRKVI